jgi:hypothetical protein
LQEQFSEIHEAQELGFEESVREQFLLHCSSRILQLGKGMSEAELGEGFGDRVFLLLPLLLVIDHAVGGRVVSCGQE